MCWKSDIFLATPCGYAFRAAKPAVAEEDIRVFKITYEMPAPGVYASYFHPFFGWTLGRAERIPDCLPEEANWLREGLHSYAEDCAVNRDRNTVSVMAASSGKHGPTLAHYMSAPNDVGHLARMECVIPKGTRYYANARGEYVSETLMPLAAERICDRPPRLPEK